MINRRRVLELTAATALFAPAVLRQADALSSSGRINLFAWGDYFDKNNVLRDFETATGITVSLSTYGSNEECENKLRASGATGFDVIFPSVDTGPNYYRDKLLQEIDERRFQPQRVLPAIYRNSLALGASHRGKRYLVPFIWGTEAITYDSSKFPRQSGELSWGDLWADGLDRQVAIRQKSIFTSIALYLDATGRAKSNRAMDMYKSEESARRVFEDCLKFAVQHKRNIGAYWNSANEALNSFSDAGCRIGQTWDATGILLNRKTDKKWRYGMPREGGLAWTDTLAIPAGAAHVEQAYAFINYIYQPEVGGAFANSTGYNSCANGTVAYLDAEARAAFEMAYAPGTIDNLWWWPIQTPFFGKLRAEFVEKLTNA